MGIERVLFALFAAVLRLYPREFRLEFGAEMQAVFSEALSAARQGGMRGMIRVAIRELEHLPGSLLREYWEVRSARMKAKSNIKQRDLGAGHWMKAPMSWREALLGALPFVLILVLDVVLNLFVETGVLAGESPGMEALNISLGLVLGGTFLLVLVLAFRRGWPLWSASWYLFFCLLAFLPLGWLLSLVLSTRAETAFQNLNLFVGLPLLLAALLYWVARTDRLQGMLAALPILYYLWFPNMEETPLTQIPFGVEMLVKTVSTALVTLAVISILRVRDWRRAFWIILLTILAVGLQFSYVGTYHGGTLPHSALGPSLVEVVRSFFPQYLAVSSILIGPLFARRFRELGRRSGLAGNFAYHLALVGLLLVISINLVGQMAGTGSIVGGANALFYSSLDRWLDIALGGYVLGLLLLFWAAWRVNPRPAWAEIALLSVLPLGIPLTFVLPFVTWNWPVSELYGIPALWVIPEPLSLAGGFTWLLLSIWLITREEKLPASPASAPQPA